MTFPRILPIWVFGCFFVMGLLAGCDQAETPPAEPTVVRKKISPPPERLTRAPEPDRPVPAESAEDTDSSATPETEPDSSGDGDLVARADDGEEAAEAPTPGTDASSGDDPAEERGSRERAEAPAEEADPPSETVATAPRESAEAEPAAEGEEIEPTEPAAEGPSEETEGTDDMEMAPLPPDEMDGSSQMVAYNAEGLVDPFEPLFREEPEVSEEEESAEEEGEAPEKPKRRLTPLERLELSQLKLVGIIRTPSGDRALVEEASGKGYIITRGTYIGIHSGQVVEIQEDGIIVEEKHENLQGEVNIRRRELKFQRPSGDEIL